MWEERLYQPDFSCIFGQRYSNAFIYGQIDSLVWPIFIDVEKSDSLKNLLKFKNKKGREYFYHRKISLEDELVELSCSNIDIALIQAMNLGRDYGIENNDVLSVVKTNPKIFKAILSFNSSSETSKKDILKEIEEIESEIEITGIVLYPSFIKLDLNNENNDTLKNLIKLCKEKNYFIKIDVGNQYFPENFTEYTSYEKIKSFLSKTPDNIIILSGLDISGDFNLYYQLLKYYDNLWIEVDPRSFGGMTPTDCFSQLFKLKGFIQNCWQRILIGSATPTLESSQMVRGFSEAIENLPFSQRCILKTWAFRNINRINSNVFKPVQEINPDMYRTIIETKQTNVIETESEIDIIYKIKLRSYSVTQLIYLTDLINQTLNDPLKEYPNVQNGELMVRTYHTTTSLIANEHEHGNYLDLHYIFAEISKKDSSQFLHTVKAMENRPDFNHYDHELASTYGHRQLILPITNRKLDVGERENFYIVVTFGPRTFNLFVKIKFFKEK